MKKHLLFALSLLLGLSLFGCQGPSDDPADDNGIINGEVLLRATSTIIRANGVDATTFSVLQILRV